MRDDLKADEENYGSDAGGNQIGAKEYRRNPAGSGRDQRLKRRYPAGICDKFQAVQANVRAIKERLGMQWSRRQAQEKAKAKS